MATINEMILPKGGQGEMEINWSAVAETLANPIHETMQTDTLIARGLSEAGRDGYRRGQEHAVIDSEEREQEVAPFQARVMAWSVVCFPPEHVNDKMQRGHRFYEEATEVVQAIGMPREDMHMLVDYVCDRPKGELAQEIGGAKLTLSLLASVFGIKMDQAAETELARCWANVEKIRAKQASKPDAGPLPGGAVRAPKEDLTSPRFNPAGIVLYPIGLTTYLNGSQRVLYTREGQLDFQRSMQKSQWLTLQVSENYA